MLDLFIDETMVQMREMTIGAESPGGGSLLKGQELATTFSFLRPNDLVWNYVVGNYLKGETPPPFDLLYWNSDGTNLPGPMYCWYLRNTYLENNLVKPGKVTVCGEKIDLGAIDVPSLSSTPRAKTTSCRGTAPTATRRCSRARRRFVLGASGHIAGVINPPAKKQAQPLDRRERGAAGDGRGLVRQGRASTRAAGGPTGPTGSTAIAGKQVAAPKTPGNAQVQADRARARPLRESRRPEPQLARADRIHPLIDQESPMTTDIVIVAAARTAVGKFGGTLAKTPAPELGAAVIAELLERAKLARRPDRRGHPRPGADRRLGPEPGAPDRSSRAACRKACRR